MNENQAPIKSKFSLLSKTAHGGLYKTILWATIIAVSITVFITIISILFLGFTESTAKVAGITWNVFWFGLMAIIFARFYEKSTSALSRAISVISIVFSIILLIIGVYQLLRVQTHSYYFYQKDPFNEFLEKTQIILNIFIYSAIFAEIHLRIKSTNQAIIILKNTTLVALCISILMADIVVLSESYFSITDDMFWRFEAIFTLLTITGFIITRILASIYRKTEKSQSNQITPEQPIQSEQPTQPAPASSESSFNKAYLIAKLGEKTGRPEQECMIISNVLENHFLIGHKSKDEITKDFISSLNIDENTADELYNICIDTIMRSVFRR